jgi:chromate reductase, NAD(P)H dehydrogenase (quinone)
VSRRVLLICGSLQSKSSNRAALDVAEAHLRRLGGVELEYADELASIPGFNPDQEAEPGAAVAKFGEKIARSDVVMIATPEYAGAIAGALKNALDWLVGTGSLYSKPAVVLSAGTTGGVHARSQLIQTLTWQGAHVVGELAIAAPRTKSDASGRFTDAATIADIEQLAQIAFDAPTMTDDDRLSRVRDVVTGAGIEPGHIAPVV